MAMRRMRNKFSSYWNSANISSLQFSTQAGHSCTWLNPTPVCMLHQCRHYTLADVCSRKELLTNVKTRVHEKRWVKTRQTWWTGSKFQFTHPGRNVMTFLKVNQHGLWNRTIKLCLEMKRPCIPPQICQKKTIWVHPSTSFKLTVNEKEILSHLMLQGTLNNAEQHGFDDCCATGRAEAQMRRSVCRMLKPNRFNWWGKTLFFPIALHITVCLFSLRVRRSVQVGECS